MSPNRKSKEFKALQDTWYAKLKAEGFDDIETDEDHLKLWTAHYFGDKNRAATAEAKEAYFKEAGSFLYEYEFKSELEYKIWELHADGLSIREIVSKLRESGIKTYRDKVFRTISRLAELVVQRCLTSSN